jgi:CRP/FNR family cyclic AMP-dependent transcriptional regulator
MNDENHFEDRTQDSDRSAEPRPADLPRTAAQLRAAMARTSERKLDELAEVAEKVHERYMTWRREHDVEVVGAEVPAESNDPDERASSSATPVEQYDVAVILASADQPLRELAATEQQTTPSQATPKAEKPRNATAEAEERSASGGDGAALPNQGALLAYLADADRDYLLGRGVRRRFRANDVVLMEGDPSDHVHVLVSGWVRVSTIIEDGREVLFGLRGPGEVLGDLAAVTGRPRTASVRAIEPCTVFQLTGAQFVDVLRVRPEIALATIKTVAARLRFAESARIDSAAFDVSRRVAVHLVRLVEEHGRTVPEGVVIEAALSQADIAAQAGAARRTVARALGVLRVKGIVEIGRRRILIRRLHVLRALARSEPNAEAALRPPGPTYSPSSAAAPPGPTPTSTRTSAPC